jgi:hypothetical protein
VRLATFSGDMTGCGPFRHDDPRDRPPAITGSSQTLWTGGARDAYLLLPVIPRTDPGGVGGKSGPGAA